MITATHSKSGAPDFGLVFDDNKVHKGSSKLSTADFTPTINALKTHATSRETIVKDYIR